jgi:hypothetical protein
MADNIKIIGDINETELFAVLAVYGNAVIVPRPPR